jgi:hypothetical protein
MVALDEYTGFIRNNDSLTRFLDTPARIALEDWTLEIAEKIYKSKQIKPSQKRRYIHCLTILMVDISNLISQYWFHERYWLGVGKQLLLDHVALCFPFIKLRNLEFLEIGDLKDLTPISALNRVLHRLIVTEEEEWTN